MEFFLQYSIISCEKVTTLAAPPILQLFKGDTGF